MAEAFDIVQRFALNEHGRDFVIGDIHGAYDLVKAGMRAVSFNRQKDRLFVVGDLIDRGPGSDRVVEFLAQPYVHAVRGNHDHFFVDMDDPDAIRALGAANFNGLRWAAALSNERLEAVRSALSCLPMAIEVETRRGHVGLVHADVPAGMDWQSFLAKLVAGDEDSFVCAIESRRRIQSRDESGVAGIGRVFVGHTVQWDGARRLGNVYAIDTGAVFRELDKDRGALTIANLVFKTGSITAQTQGAVHALASEGVDAFGQYARQRGG